MNNQEHQWNRDPDMGKETQGHRSRLGGLPSMQSQRYDGSEYIGTKHQQTIRVSSGRRPVEGDFPKEESSKGNFPNRDPSDRRPPNRRSVGGGFTGKGGPGGSGPPEGGLPGGGPHGGDSSGPNYPYGNHKSQEPDLPKGQRDIHRSMSNSTDYTGVRQVGDYHFDRKLKPEIVPTWNEILTLWLVGSLKLMICQK